MIETFDCFFVLEFNEHRFYEELNGLKTYYDSKNLELAVSRDRVSTLLIFPFIQGNSHLQIFLLQVGTNKAIVMFIIVLLQVGTNKAIVMFITVLLGVALALMGLDIDLHLVWQALRVSRNFFFLQIDQFKFYNT